MRLSSQSPGDAQVAESAWELVCVGTRQPSSPSTSTKALYLTSWSPITEGRLLNKDQEEKWSVGERHIWALGDAEVAPCPIPSVEEVLIESLGIWM